MGLRPVDSSQFCFPIGAQRFSCRTCFGLPLGLFRAVRGYRLIGLFKRGVKAFPLRLAGRRVRVQSFPFFAQCRNGGGELFHLAFADEKLLRGGSQFLACLLGAPARPAAHGFQLRLQTVQARFDCRLRLATPKH